MWAQYHPGAKSKALECIDAGTAEEIGISLGGAGIPLLIPDCPTARF